MGIITTTTREATLRRASAAMAEVRRMKSVTFKEVDTFHLPPITTDLHITEEPRTLSQVPPFPQISGNAKFSRSISLYPKPVRETRKLKNIDEDCTLRGSLGDSDEDSEDEEIVAGLGNPHRPKTVQQNLPAPRERRLSDAGKPFTDTTPFSSVVDVIVFKNLYYNDWDKQLCEKCEIETQTQNQDPYESLYADIEPEPYCPVEEQKSLLEEVKSHGKQFEQLSIAGQIAMMKSYDDEIRPSITSLYPRYSRNVHRMKTPNPSSSRSHVTEVSSAADKRGLLRRASSIFEAVKVEKGQRDGCMKQRPRSRKLVKAYNSGWNNGN